AGQNIVRNQRVKAVLSDSVPLINADDVWQLKDDLGNLLTGLGTTVAIIDTGVDYTHPDLGGCLGASCKVIGGYDFVNLDSDPKDDMGHGTHVAAIAAGEGTLNGVAPGAKILAYKVLDKNGLGSWSSVIAGIDRALDPNQDGDLSDAADVMNLSLGGGGNPDDPVSLAVDNAVRAGSVVVVAAGNSGPREGTIGSPGTAREAVTVGATDKIDNMAISSDGTDFSSRGPVIWSEKALLKPDLTAPGLSICAAEWDSWIINRRCLDNSHISISGTSMATPHVAGAALLLKQKNPNWTPYDIKSVLRKTSKPLQWDIFSSGYGRLDVLTAVNSPKLPIAKISTNQYKVSETLLIKGTAGSPNFKEYRIEESGISSQIFRKLYTSAVPVDNATLYSLDTTNLSEGAHIIRLVVTDISGNENEDRISVIVNNFEITSVGDNLNYVSGKAKVKGKVPLSGVSQYKVEINNQAFCSQSAPVGGVLCKVDLSVLPNNSYFMRIAALKNGIWLYGESFKVVVLHELMSGWPREIANFFPVGMPKINNLDADSQVELMVPVCGGWCMSWKYAFFDHTGSNNNLIHLSDGWPLNGDGLPLIFRDDLDNANLIMKGEYPSKASGLPTKLKIFDVTGKIRYSWNLPINVNSSSASSPKTIFENKIYTTLLKNDVGAYIPNIYGFDKLGNILPGFPIVVKTEKYAKPIFPSQKLVLKENDENRVVVFGGDYNFYSKTSSTDMSGMQLFLTLDIYSEGKIIKRNVLFDDPTMKVMPYFSNLAAADINGDGKLEIVVGYTILDVNRYASNQFDNEAYRSYIKIFDLDGVELGNYSISGYQFGSGSMVAGNVANRLAIGNFGTMGPLIIATLQYTWPTQQSGEKIIALDTTGKLILDKNIPDGNIQGLTIGDV
ncbi:MAG: S8 family serine peptidase, partial [Candidatus Taylorbacteria bacterium]|nr:S8 family serine peptidase [Candidatus Taylorbacteria bacterium]